MDSGENSADPVDTLASALLAQLDDRRRVIAVAGPPGSGKSTFCARLDARLNRESGCKSSVLPMDGYHYDDAILMARGLYARKGAANTFDVAGLHSVLARLRQNEEPEIAVPVFDRDLEVARAAARVVGRDVNLLIVEGNYLLLNRAPWSSLHPFFDDTVMLLADEDELRRRLVKRWETYGISPHEITRKVEANDLPNGHLVTACSVEADFLVRF